MNLPFFPQTEEGWWWLLLGILHLTMSFGVLRGILQKKWNPSSPESDPSLEIPDTSKEEFDAELERFVKARDALKNVSSACSNQGQQPFEKASVSGYSGE